MRGKGTKGRPADIAKAVTAEAKSSRPSPLGCSHEPGDIAIEGETVRRRVDRPGRKLGGRVGADSAPLSTAATATGGRIC